MTNSAQALEQFRRKPDDFDLVITDLTMPKLNGIELAKSIFEIRPKMPIILCTGYNELSSSGKARAPGIPPLLMKPYECQNLAWAIRKVLDESNDRPPPLENEFQEHVINVIS